MMNTEKSKELHEVAQKIEVLLRPYTRQEREAIATLAGKILELGDSQTDVIGRAQAQVQ